MIPADAAWQTIRAHARQLESTRLPLISALGRTLRADAHAEADSPPFDASAMDGYAFRRAETTAPFRVIGTSKAGAAFTGSLAPGECVRIFTGAPVPADADCVVKQEDIIREGDDVSITNKISGPDFIRRRGENRRSGDIVVTAGSRLGPTELAALASAGIAQPEVTRAPRCVHLITGDELVAPDQTPVGAQIRDSNSILIAALLQEHGAELLAQLRVPDDLAAARALIEALPAHDLLLVSGGASVGDHDIARPLLEALGFSLHFQQINLHPGKPLVFASHGSRLAFALPGNPVSHWVLFQLFVAPLLRLMQTGRINPLDRHSGHLAAGTQSPPANTRQTFWPCRAVFTHGSYEITPLRIASSGDSSGLVGANALLPVPQLPGSLNAGQAVEFLVCDKTN